MTTHAITESALHSLQYATTRFRPKETAPKFRNSFGAPLSFNKSGLHFWVMTGYARFLWESPNGSVESGLFYRLFDLHNSFVPPDATSKGENLLIHPFMVGIDVRHAQPTAIIQSEDLKYARLLKKRIDKHGVLSKEQYVCKTVPWGVCLQGLQLVENGAPIYSTFDKSQDLNGGISVSDLGGQTSANIGGFVVSDGNLYGLTAVHPFTSCEIKTPVNQSTDNESDDDDGDDSDEDGDDFEWTEKELTDTRKDSLSVIEAEEGLAEAEPWLIGHVQFIPDFDSPRWLDCALVRISSDFPTKQINMIRDAGPLARTLHIAVMKGNDHDCPVYFSTKSHGLVHGTMLMTSCLLKTRYSQYPLKVYPIIIREQLALGCSGSWVVKYLEGNKLQMVGMLIAACDYTNMCYCIGAEQILSCFSDSSNYKLLELKLPNSSENTAISSSFEKLSLNKWLQETDTNIQDGRTADTDLKSETDLTQFAEGILLVNESETQPQHQLRGMYGPSSIPGFPPNLDSKQLTEYSPMAPTPQARPPHWLPGASPSSREGSHISRSTRDENLPFTVRPSGDGWEFSGDMSSGMHFRMVQGKDGTKPDLIISQSSGQRRDKRYWTGGPSTSPSSVRLASLGHFRIRKPWEFWNGLVIAFMHHEAYNPDTESHRSASRNVSSAILDVKVYSQIFRVIIMEAGRGQSQAIPISTYGGRATTEPGIIPSNHLQVYSGFQPAPVRPGEYERGLRKPPIRIRMREDERLDRDSIRMRDDESLDRDSRVDFSKTLIVGHSQRVSELGSVDTIDFPILRTCWEQSGTQHTAVTLHTDPTHVPIRTSQGTYGSDTSQSQSVPRLMVSQPHASKSPEVPGNDKSKQNAKTFEKYQLPH